MSAKQSKRAPNFTSREKSVLLNIVFNYKHIIENKKTDSITWREKDHCWTKLTSIFNSQNPENIARSKESLRKLYDNLKKNVRQEVANDRAEIKKTGGGKPEDKPKDPATELILGIVNERTIYGLTDSFGGDSVLYDEPQPSTSYSSETLQENTNLGSVIEIADNLFIGDMEMDHTYCNNINTSEPIQVWYLLFSKYYSEIIV